MAKEKRFSPPAVGGISLLVVFAVLCLTVFALLSLTTVQADVRLYDASAQMYQAAQAAAQAQGQAGPGAPQDDGVVDADYRDVDENN